MSTDHPHRFRKRPVIIEARQWFDTEQQREEFAAWFFHYGHEFRTRGSVIEIATTAGTHQAQIGDWVILGVKDEFYSCKPDIFAMTYERVPE